MMERHSPAVWTATVREPSDITYDQLSSLQSLNIDDRASSIGDCMFAMELTIETQQEGDCSMNTSPSVHRVPQTAAQMAEQLGDKSFSALWLDQENFTMHMRVHTNPPVQQVPQTAAQMAEQLGDKSFSALMLDQEDFLLDAGLSQHPDGKTTRQLLSLPRARPFGPFADYALPHSSGPQHVGLRPQAYPVSETQFETQGMKLDRLMAQLADSQRPVKTLSQR